MSTDLPRAHHQPRIEERPPVPYLGITARAEDEAGFRAAVDRDMPALFGRLAERRLTPAAAPFLRYLVVDESAVPEDGPPPSTFECGVPLAAPADGDDLLHPGELPGGRWLVTLHVGGYTGLGDVHRILHEWAADAGATVARTPAEGGTAFGGSFEHFRVGPFEQPDPWRWETDVAYLLED